MCFNGVKCHRKHVFLGYATSQNSMRFCLVYVVTKFPMVLHAVQRHRIVCVFLWCATSQNCMCFRSVQRHRTVCVSWCTTSQNCVFSGVQRHRPVCIFLVYNVTELYVFSGVRHRTVCVFLVYNVTELYVVSRCTTSQNCMCFPGVNVTELFVFA